MPTDRAYDDEISLGELFAIVRGGLKEVVAIALFAGAVTYLVTGMMNPVFRAQATLIISSQDGNQRDFGTTLVTAPVLDVGTYRTALTSRSVVNEALQRLEAAEPTESTAGNVAGLGEALNITSEGSGRSAVLRVRVEDENPVLARDLANAVAEASVAWDERRATDSLETIVASLEAQIRAVDAELDAVDVGDTEDASGADARGLENTRADLALQLSSARALRTAAVGSLEMLEPAATPSSPVRPRPVLAALLATVLATFAGYLLVFLREAVSSRVRDVDDLAQITGIPVLTEFPSVATGRRGLPREAASYLRTSVDFATADAHPKIITVTSTDAKHGKSSVSIALAESYARQGHRVLLLDADLRKPVIGSEYGLRDADVQTTRQALEQPDGARPTMIEISSGVSLDVIPGFAAVPDPTELLGHGIRSLLDRLAPDYDVIVVDTAPVIPVADALAVAPFSTGVVFTVSLPDADRKNVKNALELLQRLNVRLIGTVATNVESKASRRKGAYGYGYGYGYGTQVAAAAGAPTVSRVGRHRAASETERVS